MLFYYGLSGAALMLAISLLWQKYISKHKRAQRDRGAYTMFALIMILASIGAFTLGTLTT